MRYPDKLYGEWELPRIVERLIHTKEMVRLRNIAQSNIPSNISPYGPVPSRFQHSMGVCYLASQAIKPNQAWLPEDKKELLLVSALLHDTGNPPFSHLSERFLKDVFNKDGEEFLENILADSETERILKEYTISTNQVLEVVMGKEKPFSDILHGSMDVDNMDNVPRFLNALGMMDRTSSFSSLASAFRFRDYIGWYLPASSMHDVYYWQEMRRRTYLQVYSSLYASIMTMLSRAVELAFAEGNVKEDFFFLDDISAMAYLQKNSDKATQSLIDCLIRWEWYREILAYEWKTPPPAVTSRMLSWEGRYRLAEVICDKTGIPRERLCIFLKSGREARDVTIPFLAENGNPVEYANLDVVPLTRLRVYVHEDYKNKASRVKEVVKEELL